LIAVINGERRNETLGSGPMTIRTFCERYSWPSEAAMRAYVHRAPKLGLTEAFIRVNRRVLVDPQTFFSLIKEANNNRLNQGGIHETKQKDAAKARGPRF
jgi:hypothetical protein